MKIFNKQIILALVLFSMCISMITTLGSLSSLKMNTKFSSFLKKHKIKSNSFSAPPKNLTADDLPDGVPIYYQGWIKYFHYLKNPDSKSSKPKFFFKNEAFLTQEKDGNKSEESDGVSFYFIIYLEWKTLNSK